MHSNTPGTSTTEAATTPRVRLRGHRGPVLCLSHSSDRRFRRRDRDPRRTGATRHSRRADDDDEGDDDDDGDGEGNDEKICDAGDDEGDNDVVGGPSLLLSGSEDGTARLWDLRCASGGGGARCCFVAPSSEAEPDDADPHGGSSAGRVAGIVPEVTSVAFHPSSSSYYCCDGVDDSSNGGGFYDCTVYMSAGDRVYGYDLRRTDAPSIVAPVVRREPDHDLSDLLGCGDEINELSFSCPPPGGGGGTKNGKGKGGKGGGGGGLRLSAADDSGEVRVTAADAAVPDRRSRRPQQTQTRGSSRRHAKRGRCPAVLHHADDGTLAMVSCAAFRPRGTGRGGGVGIGIGGRSDYLASGGTDCIVRLWDVTRPRWPASSHRIERTDSGANQVCNPPFVHSLSWSPSGRLLAAGAGDGTVVILGTSPPPPPPTYGKKKAGGDKAGNGRLTEVARLSEGGHAAAAASVAFPDFGIAPRSSSSSDPPSASRDDRLLVSAGNDRRILLWDLGAGVCGAGAADPCDFFSFDGGPGRAARRRNGSGGGTAVVDEESGDTDESVASAPKVLLGISHPHKPNWIACGRASEPVYPASLFVADTSCDITGYVLPT